MIISTFDATILQYRLPSGAMSGLIRVFDVQGRMITSKTIKNNGTFRFASADNAAGNYRVSIETNDAPALRTSFVVIE